MKSKKIIIYMLFLILLILFVNSDNKKVHKCSSHEIIPKKVKELQINENYTYTRKLEDDNEFQDFNIVLELKNIETEIELYNLTQYQSLIINSMKKAVETMKSLIKVKPYSC